MAESFKDKLAVFKPGAQRIFIESLERTYHTEKIAEICSCSTRTIRDWRREKYDMHLACVDALSKFACIPFPEIRNVRERYGHVSRAGRKGAQVVMSKYGRVPVDENQRKKQWNKWWQKYGRFSQPPRFEAKPVHKPTKSIELAEFIGTMMGDGGMSRYQAAITLHHIDDREYIDIVMGRIQRLFKIKPSLYHIPKSSVFNIVISRAGIVTYLHSLGLPIGNKVRQQFDIPDWIKGNKKYVIACVRGLVDTDGSVFTHSYKVKGKWYHYKKLSFCSRSQPLQYSVAKVLTDLGMRARITGYDVRLDSVEDMEKYFTTVGSSNPKHLKRCAK